MQLAKFTQSNQDPQRPSGPCEVGGVAAHCFFERSGPDGAARVAVRFDMSPRAPLPQFARDRAHLEIAGAQVPVRAVELECGAEALQGSLDPALVEAVAGPAAPPDPSGDLPVDPPAAPEPPASKIPEAGASGAPQPEAPVANPVLAKARAWQDASSRATAGAEQIRVQRRLARSLRQQAAEAEEDLAELESGQPALQQAAACLRQELRDALDREES